MMFGKIVELWWEDNTILVKEESGVSLKIF
jgi:hypothetical protein